MVYKLPTTTAPALQDTGDVRNGTRESKRIHQTRNSRCCGGVVSLPRGWTALGRGAGVRPFPLPLRSLYSANWMQPAPDAGSAGFEIIVSCVCRFKPDAALNSYSDFLTCCALSFIESHSQNPIPPWPLKLSIHSIFFIKWNLNEVGRFWK
jgi:hypothetical protein